MTLLPCARHFWLLVALFVLSSPARALDLRLTSGDWRPINIFVEKFAGEETLAGQPLSGVIHDDLSHTGLFRSYSRTVSSYGGVDTARLVDVRNRGGEYLLTGQVRKDGAAELLFFELHDALTEKSLGAFSINFDAQTQRTAAHQVGNWVFESITRKPGIFHTKVAYVRRAADGSNALRVADYDGHNAQTILTSDNNIISPTWTPDGNELLYVSFERRKPVVYRQSLLNGERRVVANFRGSNSAPAMSPDGRRIAAALTEHGGLQQIYLLGGNSKQQMRPELESGIINTEPTFSPDGKRIAFTSDEGGSPQIYEYSLDSGLTRRLTFGGREAVSPDYDSAGARMVYVQRQKGANNIALLDLSSGNTVVLTDIQQAAAPTFSPNDVMVLFNDEKKRGSLSIVSVNGKVLSGWGVKETGKIINPVWGPIKSKWY
ncbi:Tol-Pal system protein TolB [Candidatus Persebacteraceae bacterium Df01]|jgi:TolB protein|uniref:Tol-Pal system protein TolB n=1 Tax=Candidatus Doriopsillibacter californiensis TaxID=2970740 RepID=A0ABT7QJK7_9GAMM|nr:Tol-Pal system protein TolB [Candidatus Persebacteraceae bacterium Df01]